MRGVQVPDEKEQRISQASRAKDPIHNGDGRPRNERYGNPEDM